MHTTDAGHRSRVKARFLAEGLENFQEVHALELLLFYAVPRQDTKPLAKALLEHFGSYTAVMEATAAELQMVSGVGEHVATYLKLITEAGRYYLLRAGATDLSMSTTEKYGDYLLQQFYGLRNETVFLLCLDAKCKLLCCRKLSEGDVNCASVPLRRAVEMALSVNATSVVLAHNHPSGIAIPSQEDREVTHRLAQALGAMGIILVDHIVVADGDYVSLTQSRMHDPRRYCAFE